MIFVAELLLELFRRSLSQGVAAIGAGGLGAREPQALTGGLGRRQASPEQLPQLPAWAATGASTGRFSAFGFGLVGPLEILCKTTTINAAMAAGILLAPRFFDEYAMIRIMSQSSDDSVPLIMERLGKVSQSNGSFDVENLAAPGIHCHFCGCLGDGGRSLSV